MDKSRSKSRVQGRALCKPAPLGRAEGELPNSKARLGHFPSRCRAFLRGRARKRRERNEVGPNLRPQGLMDVCCQLPFPPLLLHPFSSHPKVCKRRGRSAGRENKPDKSPEAPRLFPPALPAAPAPLLPLITLTGRVHLLPLGRCRTPLPRVAPAAGGASRPGSGSHRSVPTEALPNRATSAGPGGRRRGREGRMLLLLPPPAVRPRG